MRKDHCDWLKSISIIYNFYHKLAAELNKENERKEGILHQNIILWTMRDTNGECGGGDNGNERPLTGCFTEVG